MSFRCVQHCSSVSVSCTLVRKPSTGMPDELVDVRRGPLALREREHVRCRPHRPERVRRGVDLGHDGVLVERHLGAVGFPAAVAEERVDEQ